MARPGGAGVGMPDTDRRSIFEAAADRFLAASERAPPGWRGLPYRIPRTLYLAYREFHRNLCWERAGTLSFSTLLSLIPLTVLFLSFVSLFWTQEDLKGFVQRRLLVYMVPDENLRGSLWSLINEEINIAPIKLQAGVSIAAVVVLLLASAALVASAERVFNRLWDAASSRTYLQKLRIFWIILTTSPVALGVSLYVDQATREGTVIGTLKQSYWLLGALYTFLLPAVVSLVAFTIVNIILPNARVRLRPALLGGLVAACLWEAGKKGFYLYIRESHNVSRFYGSLGILPVFLLWIYITWLITLYGAEVARVAQDSRRLPKPRRDPPEGPAASPFLAVYVLDRIYAAFESGARIPGLDQIAASVGASADSLEPVVRSLVETGILVEDSRNPGQYAPLRAPALVRLREVIEPFSQDLSPEDLAARIHDPEDPVLLLFRGARSAFLGSMGDRTLKDLISSHSADRN